MKNKFQIILFCLFLLMPFIAKATVTTFTTAGPGTWTAPNGVTSVIVDTWAGGGGGGGSNGADNGGGGGAGGGFASTTITVVPGTTYNYYVAEGGTAGATNGAGGAGKDSMFQASSTVLSKGGGGGAAGNGGTASGGSAVNSIVGTVFHYGGNGGNGVNLVNSGGGGGGAGSGGNGTNAVADTNGIGGSPDGGNGGAGRLYNDNAAGIAGSTIGGGGSGGIRSGGSNRAGGAGARGQIQLTYTINIVTPTATTSAATSVAENSATLNGNITNTGAMIGAGTQYGFTYGTSSDLSTVIATTTKGTYSATGTFTDNISSLSCNTTYYARAYVTNSAGTGFSSIISFTTTACLARYWYNSGADANWTTLTGNWWADSGHLSQAGALPTASDSITTLGTIGPNVDLLTWVKPLSINATATGITFTSAIATSTGLNITGTTTFNGASYNANTITGNAIFNGTSYNAGTVSGISKFAFAIGGVATLTTGMQWGSGTSTSIIGSDDISITSWIFNNNSFNNGIIASSTFNSTSYNNATTTATTTFNGDSSENLGTVSGTKIRRYISNISPTRNFTTSLWTVLADGAIVDLSSATFNSTTTFSTANGGSFSTIPTNCSSPLLGGGLNYVLSGNITATCTIGNNNITLDGASHTLTGDINGNGTSNGANGYNFTLSNITVTGSVTADGATGSVNGGNGATTTILFSTTGNVSANGGNGATNGGNGGSLIISTTTSLILSANGGNSTTCGYGGSGGNMNLIDVNYSTSTVNAGNDQTVIGSGLCVAPPSGSSGSTGTRIIITSPPHSASGSSGNSQQSYSSSGSGSILSVNQLAALGIIPLPKFNIFNKSKVEPGTSDLGDPLENIASPGVLKFSFKSFSFVEPLNTFVSAPLPDSVQKILKKNEKLNSFLAGVGFSKAQDLANLAVHPILLPVLEFDPPGLFIIADSGIRLTTYLASDPKHLFVEMVETTPGAKLAVSLIPPNTKDKFTGNFDGKSINFTQNHDRISVNIIASTTPGRYFLTTPASSLALAIDVKSSSKTPESISENQGFISKLFSWLKKLF